MAFSPNNVTVKYICSTYYLVSRLYSHRRAVRARQSKPVWCIVRCCSASIGYDMFSSFVLPVFCWCQYRYILVGMASSQTTQPVLHYLRALMSLASAVTHSRNVVFNAVHEYVVIAMDMPSYDHLTIIIWSYDHMIL